VCVECSCEDGSTEKKVCPHTIDGTYTDALFLLRCKLRETMLTIE
jgi:hypothetical protein